MKTYGNLYLDLCSYENFELALSKARKRKTAKHYVIEFEANKEKNLKQLQYELESFTYCPRPLTNFVIRDPKTRKISASDFRDRVVYHALCNIILPIFERTFIHDSFANQKGKGTHNAITRFERFLRSTSFFDGRAVSWGGGGGRYLEPRPVLGYALKADILHYFDTVNHEILFRIISRKIKDKNVLWLIRTILENPKMEITGVGMPLGNLTSQFFANIYLHELDMFVKHGLKAKCYIRYVDDFVILHRDKAVLENWKQAIDIYLRSRLKIELHPEKSRIVEIKDGVTLLGFRVFYNHRLLKKSNSKRIWKRLQKFKQQYNSNQVSSSEGLMRLEGWLSYAKFANSYKLRINVISKFNNIVLKVDDEDD